MILMRLALRNARRSVRDTAVYFITIVTAVVVFVMFNSLDQQPAWHLAQAQTGDLFAQAQTLMNVMTVIVVIVLAFLILFGNRFILRRRSREFGTYMLLGMQARTLSLMMTVESAVIGLGALALGMIIGTAAAEGASTLTSALLGNGAIRQLPFQFPTAALVRTAVAFSVIFGLALVGNIATIRRLSLTALINYERQIEKTPYTAPGRAVATCLAGAVAIVAGAVIVLRVGFLTLNPVILLGLILACIGTALLYAGAGSSFILIVTRTQTWYFRGLRMFASRQIGARVTSSFVSTTTVTLLLATSAVSLSSGLVLAQAARDAGQVPYDAVFYNATSVAALEHAYASKGIDLTTYLQDEVFYHAYESGANPSRLRIPATALSAQSKATLQAARQLTAISVTDYNRLAALQHRPAIHLPANKYAIISPSAQIIDALGQAPSRPALIQLAGRTLTPTSNPQLISIDNIGTTDSLVRIVVPTNVTKNLPLASATIAATFRPDVTVARAAQLSEALGQGDHIVVTRQIAELRAFSVSSMFAYIAVYLGAVLLLAAATILSIQQLIEANENRNRFQLLRKLGASEKSLATTLLAQVGLSFLVPATLAGAFTVVLLIPMAKVVTYIGGANAASATAISCAALAVLYLGYFAVAYSGAKFASRGLSAS